MTNFAPYLIDMRYLTNKVGRLMSITLLFSVTMLVGCKKDERPEGVLTKDQLSSIMMEMYLAESRLNGLSIPKDSAAKLFVPFEDSLLMRAGVPDSVMRKTYQYYFDHPDELDKVYDIMIDSLNLREQKEATRSKVIN